MRRRAAALVSVAAVAASAVWGTVGLVDAKQQAQQRAATLAERIFTPASTAAAVEAAFQDSEAKPTGPPIVVWRSKQNPDQVMAEDEFLLYVRTENDLVSLHKELAKVADRLLMRCRRGEARDHSWSAGYCTFQPAPLPGKGPKA